MKVSLVVPADPPGVNAFNQVPIGGLYTAAQLREQGDEAAFFDLRRRTDLDAAYAEIAAADLIAVFSTDYDLAQCYPSLTPAADCVRRIKAAAGPVPVVCCGSHATVNAPLTRSYTAVDGVVLGEFEFAVPRLVRHLREGAPLPEVWPLDGVPSMASEADLAGLGTPRHTTSPRCGTTPAKASSTARCGWSTVAWCWPTEAARSAATSATFFSASACGGSGAT